MKWDWYEMVLYEIFFSFRHFLCVEQYSSFVFYSFLGIPPFYCFQSFRCHNWLRDYYYFSFKVLCGCERSEKESSQQEFNLNFLMNSLTFAMRAISWHRFQFVLPSSLLFIYSLHCSNTSTVINSFFCSSQGGTKQKKKKWFILKD